MTIVGKINEFLKFQKFSYFNNRTYIQQRVAEQLDYLARMHNTAFQLSLGDNFYFTGVHDVRSTRFRVNILNFSQN
jgi:hypothetical protein